MILDQTICSARAEKHKEAVTRRMFRGVLTAFVA